MENNCSRSVLWKCRGQEDEPRRGEGGDGTGYPGPSLGRRHCPLCPHSPLSARENNTYRQKPPLRKKACPNHIFVFFRDSVLTLTWPIGLDNIKEIKGLNN